MKYIIMMVAEETFDEALLDREESVKNYYYVSQKTFTGAEEVKED